MNLEDFDGKKPKELFPTDSLFLSQVTVLINDVTNAFAKYEYSKAKQIVEQFFWRDFCDYYLEIVKKRVYQGTGKIRKSAQYALYQGLLTIIKMIAPIMPFISEEIYQEHFKKFEKDKSIHISSWPKENLWELRDASHEGGYWNALLEVIGKVRQEKTKAKKSMNSEIILTLSEFNKAAVLVPYLDDLRDVTNASEIKQGKFKVEFK
jgi:valyl-tRNA synthetase